MVSSSSSNLRLCLLESRSLTIALAVDECCYRYLDCNSHGLSCAPPPILNPEPCHLISLIFSWNSSQGVAARVSKQLHSASWFSLSRQTLWQVYYLFTTQSHLTCLAHSYCRNGNCCYAPLSASGTSCKHTSLSYVWAISCTEIIFVHLSIKQPFRYVPSINK